MISLHNATLVYGDAGARVFAVREASLSVNPGEFVGILGPSGSGKSSLLYLMSGLKMPTDGVASWDGQSYREMSDADRSRLRRRRFGFVFQQPYLLGYMNAVENVLVAASRGPDDRERAVSLLERLGLRRKMHRFPHELSGGEKQRVCIARALVNDPDIVFADEPTASLDRANGLAVVGLLETCRGHGSVVLVTHDREMLAKADHIVAVSDGVIEESTA